MKDKENLNDVWLKDDIGEPVPRPNNSAASSNIEVLFDGLEDRMIELIQGSGIVIGCMAWLTNLRILDALQGRECAIVVQKEDLWRPDIGQPSQSKTGIAAAYERLKCSAMRHWFEDTELVGVSTLTDCTMGPVRCVGNHNSERRPAMPRMHNKFLLFGRWRDGITEFDYTNPWIFSAVWTGSFNASWNATRSLENALVIKDEAVTRAYYQEWASIYAMSEPLDWTSEWTEPEWRIGT